MEQPYYTPEELELLNQVPSQPSEPQNLPQNVVDYREQIPLAPTDTVYEKVNDFRQNVAPAVDKINSTASIVSAAISVFVGIMFIAVPLSMMSSMIFIFQSADAEEQTITLMPIAFLLVFIIVGVWTAIKGVKNLIKCIRKK